MPILANVVTTDTFDTWRIRTNQLIVQSNQSFDMALNAFNYSNNALNNVVIIASNTAANIVSSNAYIIAKITENVVANIYLSAPDIIYSNTLIITQIYDSANDAATLFFSTNSLGQVWNTANASFTHANSSYDKANAALSNTNYTHLFTGNIVFGDTTIYSNGLINML